jgi:hypothetical protein
MTYRILHATSLPLLLALASACDTKDMSLGEPMDSGSGTGGGSAGSGTDGMTSTSAGGSASGGMSGGSSGGGGSGTSGGSGGTTDPCEGMSFPECVACPVDLGALCGMPCDHEGLSCSNSIGDGASCNGGLWGCVVHPPLGTECNLVCEDPPAADPDCSMGDGDFPVSSDPCTTDADCIVVLHQSDCCGSLQAWGVNLEGWGAFNATEANCRADYAACECAPQPTTTEDGTPTNGGDVIVAACVSGSCTSVVAP